MCSSRRIQLVSPDGEDGRRGLFGSKREERRLGWL